MTLDRDDMTTSVFWALQSAFDSDVDVELGDSINFRDKSSGEIIGIVDVWNWTEKKEDEGDEDEDESDSPSKPSEA